jgi:hypothetical protein
VHRSPQWVAWRADQKATQDGDTWEVGPKKPEPGALGSELVYCIAAEDEHMMGLQPQMIAAGSRSVRRWRKADMSAKLDDTDAPVAESQRGARYGTIGTMFFPQEGQIFGYK